MGLRRTRRMAGWYLGMGGLLLLSFMLWQLGLTPILTSLKAIGWGFAVISAFEVIIHAFNTWGWWQTFTGAHRSVGFRRLFLVRLAGEAINYLTPLATCGGEYLKASLLRPHLPITTGLASVTMAKVSQSLALLLFVTLGVAVTLQEGLVPAVIRLPLLALLATIGALAILLLILLQRGGVSPLFRLLKHLPCIKPHLLQSLEPKLLLLDERIRDCYRGRHPAFMLSILFHFIGWALGCVEIYIILHFLGVQVNFIQAITIEALSLLLGTILFFVPGNLGTQEGGKVLIFAALGLGLAWGLSLGIIRRLRELIWVLVGLLILVPYYHRREALRVWMN